MSLVMVMIDDQPQVAEVVQANAKTVWVRLKNGDVVQRHRVKHDVGQVQES